jgi:hypothetical protein
MKKDPYIFFQKTNSFHLTKVMGTFGWRAFLFWTNDSISVSQNGLVLFHIWKKEQSHPIFFVWSREPKYNGTALSFIWLESRMNMLVPKGELRLATCWI